MKPLARASTAGVGSSPDTKSKVTSDLSVSWFRLETSSSEKLSPSEKNRRSINNRISELCNTTLLALEKMQSGYLTEWKVCDAFCFERCYLVKGAIDVDHLRRRAGSFSEAVKTSPRCASLLERLSSFG